MGREIRRVPPNWEHPRYTQDDAPSAARAGEYRPLFDGSYSEAKREWLDGLAKWEAGTHPDQQRHSDAPPDYWEWHGGPPERADYQPDWPEGEATWWQVYETVSEGTPISPPFATPDELVDWLATHQDFWGYGPQPRERAERFVKAGWVPSGVAVGGKFYSAMEAVDVVPPRE